MTTIVLLRFPVQADILLQGGACIGGYVQLAESAQPPGSGENRNTLRVIGVFCARHSAVVIGTWLLVLGAAGFFVPRFLTSLTGPSLAVPGSSSDLAEQALQHDFTAAPVEQAVIVCTSTRLTASDPAYRHAVSRVLNQVASVPHVVRVQSPFAKLPVPAISADRRTVVAVVGLRGSAHDRQAISARLQDTVRRATASTGVSAYYTGSSALTEAISRRQTVDIIRAEAFGIPIALIVLLLAFGTAVSALVPIALGFVGVGTVFGILGVLSDIMTFDVLVESIVTMIGLAIGIDYSLLLVTRYRALRHRAGSRAGAIGLTMETAGRAAMFSGVTVLVSLAGLFAVRGLVFRDVAIAVLCTVAVMLMVVLTLLPAVLERLGQRVESGRLPWTRKAVSEQESGRRWLAWAGWVTRHAGPISIVTIAIFLGLASPLSGLRLGFDSGARSLAGSPAARGYKLLSEDFSAGYASAATIIVHGATPVTSSRDLAALSDLTRRLQSNANVAGITSLPLALRLLRQPVPLPHGKLPPSLASGLAPMLNIGHGSTSTIITVMLRSAPDSPTAVSFVRHLNAAIIPAALAGTSLTAHTGGTTAQIADLETEVKAKTPVVFAIILGLSFILLMFAFRSLLLPLKAIIMNLLVVGAVGGLLVLVFQDGNFSGLLDFSRAGAIQVYLPLLAFAILFGLSMDYEVFMVTRMREFWDAGHDNSAAVAHGLADTGRIVSAASSIMFVVFAAAIATTVLQLKEIGFGLAVAVMLDASVIRLMLVPALMRLLGRWNWWMPFGRYRQRPRHQPLTASPRDSARPSLDRRSEETTP